MFHLIISNYFCSISGFTHSPMPPKGSPHLTMTLKGFTHLPMTIKGILMTNKGFSPVWFSHLPKMCKGATDSMYGLRLPHFSTLDHLNFDALLYSGKYIGPSKNSTLQSFLQSLKKVQLLKLCC